MQKPLPPAGIKEWTATKTELKRMGQTPLGAPINKRYLLPQYWQEVEAARKLIRDLTPDLIIGLGSLAQWLLLDDSRIGTFRGTFFNSTFDIPAITSYHPSAVLREYSMLPIVVMDLIKARLWLERELPNPLERKIWINPSEAELQHTWARFRSFPSRPLGVDIETCPSIDQITTISFGFPEEVIVIPIWDKAGTPAQHNVCPDAASELKTWKWIDRYCQLPNPKVLQNGLYDMQYMLDAPIPLRLAGRIEDTAIMQHAFQPELPKALGNLASYYLNEPSWKQMRNSDKDAKADD